MLSQVDLRLEKPRYNTTLTLPRGVELRSYEVSTKRKPGRVWVRPVSLLCPSCVPPPMSLLCSILCPSYVPPLSLLCPSYVGVTGSNLDRSEVHPVGSTHATGDAAWLSSILLLLLFFITLKPRVEGYRSL